MTDKAASLPGGARSEEALSDAKRRLIEARLRGKTPPPRSAAPPPPERRPPGPRRASLAESWIYFAHQAAPTAATFNNTHSYRVSGSLDPDGLERAVARVAERHEILRTGFQVQDRVLEAVPAADCRIPVVTATCGTESELLERASLFSRTPFDLARPPLLRVLYLECPGSAGLLSIVFHDIALDKWSVGIFWKEAAAFYREALGLGRADAPDLEWTYGDFVAWQAGQLSDGQLERQLEYWKTTLAGAGDPLPLPTNRPYPPHLTDAGRLARARIDAGLAAQMKRLAGHAQASPFMLLLATFQILLHRYTGSDDIVVGSPIANRRRKETADLIGFFLSTVALRTRFPLGVTARQTIASARTAVLGALEHQDVPFDRVVEAVRPPRVPGRHPLFQTMFVYQGELEAAPDLRLGDVRAEHTYVETGASRFDVTLFVAEAGDEMDLVLEYRTDLFDDATAQRMLAHFRELLASIVRDPDLLVSRLSCLTAEERALVSRSWQGERLAIDGQPDVLAQIDARCAAAPHAEAVTGAGATLTYRQLYDASHAIAQSILAADPSPRAVALMMERTPHAIAAMLGIMRAGAAYVPIDPDYPVERQRLVAEDSGIRIAVVSAALRTRVEPLVTHVVVGDAVKPPADTRVLPSITDDRLAYIIYTSGSTGTPKGALLTHRNLQHSTAARLHYYREAPRSFLLVPSFSFDSSIAGIFWTLATGGSLVLAGPDDVRDPARLVALVRKHTVTDLLCIPSLYREMLRDQVADLRSLERVIVAGEACSPSLVGLHFERLPGAALFNEYGPTEVAVWSTVHACTPEDGKRNVVPIGRPITNTRAYVLDAHGQLQPIGVPGELFLGGEGLCLGYHNRESLTRERFVERDTGDGPMRLYRTADVVRWRADGVLEFLGRTDEQLKIRGYRIEPGEIEAILEQHPAVERAVVVFETAVETAAPAASDDGGGSDLDVLIADVPPEELDRLLADVETAFQGDGQADSPRTVPAPASRALVVTRERFRVELHAAAPDFVAAPRETQRTWLLGKALAETADDVAHLDRIAGSLVRGYDHRLDRDLRDISREALTDQQIMEDWQTPLMRAMARHVTEAHGDVLEIGFGRGVSAEFIQQFGVRSHTVVESNDHSVHHHFAAWRRRQADSDIRLFHARWQDVEDRLGTYDGIFFHAFPMNEQEFTEYVLQSVTFAEHAFGPMSAHLVPGGVFTYLTTEIDSLSRSHQRSLFRHFRSVTMHVEPLDVPEDTRDTWWARSMVVVKAVK